MSRGNLVYAIADVTHDEKGYVADLTFALKFVVHRRPVYSCPLCNPDQVVGMGTIYAPRPKRLRKGGKSGRLKLAPSHGGAV